MELTKEIDEVLHPVNAIEILGEDFTGKFVTTVIDKELVGVENKISFTTLKVNDEIYRIRTPSHVAWRNKAIGDKFAITKQIKGNKCILIPSKIFWNKHGKQTLQESDIYELHGIDETKDKILGINVMEVEDEYYVIYLGKKLIRVHKTFKFDNPYGLVVSHGTKIYVDISDDSQRLVSVLAYQFDVARLHYLQLHGKGNEESKTFDRVPVTHDKFAEFHAIKNIDLVNRDYEGLVFLEPLEMRKKSENNYFRNYMSAKVNDNEVVLIKISRHQKIDGLRDKDALIVRKHTYAGANGNDLSRLNFISSMSNYKSMKLKSMHDLLVHKHGLKYYVEIDVMYVNNEYMCIYAEDRLHKIDVHSIPLAILKEFEKGIRLFKLVPRGLTNIDVFTIDTLYNKID